MKKKFCLLGNVFHSFVDADNAFLKLETGYAQTEPTSTSETNQISATPNVVPRKQGQHCDSDSANG